MKFENAFYYLLELFTSSPLASFCGGGFLVYLLGAISTSQLFFFLATMFMVMLESKQNSIPTLRVQKRHHAAVLPSKGEPDAAGYDLTAITIHKTVGDVTYYDTGLSVEPDPGYYTEIVPRSSLSKSGYVLANSVGIIDNGYRGNLLIALLKIEKEKPDLDLSKPICQLILRKQEYCNLVETDFLSESIRGTGGFGSTDRKEN